MILPKGIVVNTAGISGDIERIDREPLALEEIAKLWKGKTSLFERCYENMADQCQSTPRPTEGFLTLRLNVWRTIGGEYGVVGRGI